MCSLQWANGPCGPTLKKVLCAPSQIPSAAPAISSNLKARAGLAGDFHNFHSRMHLKGVGARLTDVKRNVRQQIGLVQNESSALKKIEGYLRGLSSPSAVAQHYDFGCFAKIVARWADQVADVFNRAAYRETRAANPQAPARSSAHPDGRCRRW